MSNFILINKKNISLLFKNLSLKNTSLTVIESIPISVDDRRDQAIVEYTRIIVDIPSTEMSQIQYSFPVRQLCNPITPRAKILVLYVGSN